MSFSRHSEDDGLGAVKAGEVGRIGLDGTATHDQADARADFIGGPRKSVDYLGLIRLRAFRSSALTSRPTALARAAIVSRVMFWSPASTKETYCCVRPVRSASWGFLHSRMERD